MAILDNERDLPVFIYNLGRESDAAYHLVRVERPTERTVQKVCSDNDGRYTSEMLKVLERDMIQAINAKTPHSSREHVRLKPTDPGCTAENIEYKRPWHVFFGAT